MRKIVALIIAAHANDRELLNIINYQKEEDVDMCESMKLYRERTLNDSERIGIITTLKTILKSQLGTLSQEIEEKITNSSVEQLELLTKYILNVHTEEDILQIISSYN